MTTKLEGLAAMLRKLTALGEEGVFSPEDVRVLGAAFDAVWASLKASGAPVADPIYQETAREVIAKFIIQAVKNGEREERALIEGALLQLSNLRSQRPNLL
jgi:hypothetical protein